MSFKYLAPAAILLAGLLCAGVARAQTTIYTCTDAKGEATIQNAPCPKGVKQEARTVKDVATQALPDALASPPAKSATPASAPAPGTPPPPLHVSAKDAVQAPPAPTGPATVIYRCTDAAGALSVQNSPCPAGSRSEKRAVQGVAAMPLPTPAGTPPPPQPAAPPAPRPDDAPPSPALPPGAADQTIQTIDGMTLITDPSLHKDDAAADALAGRKPASESDDDDDDDSHPATGPLPPPLLFKCTTYDQGTYLTEQAEPQSRCAPLKTVGLDGNAFSGSGKACQVIHDVCARVPDQGLCAAWNKRLGETEVAWRYARAQDKASRKADYDRVSRIVRETCKP